MPGEVWTWIEEQVCGRLFANGADAMSFLLVYAKNANDSAREAVLGSPFPTSYERVVGRSERIG
ncbi:hypothetical protein [Actinoplanes lobatus]|uniref:hypothetical protein n=1 Tax=Actinoplanes lobatus TaxID=113568 RepID=UPI00165FDBE3|nr:hypothetical protein [Actinoplanes lobatus]